MGHNSPLTGFESGSFMKSSMHHIIPLSMHCYKDKKQLYKLEG